MSNSKPYKVNDLLGPAESTPLNSSKPTVETPFWVASGITLLLTTSLAVSAWPLAGQGIRAEADRLSIAGERASGREAELDYHLAYRLDRHNARAALHLAAAQVAGAEYAQAIDTLQTAGQGSEVLSLQIVARLELGEYAGAISWADQLISPTSATDADLVLASLAYAAGDQQVRVSPLLARVASPEALQRMRRAQTHDLPLAGELYARGLVASSSTLLMKLPASLERNLMLGQLAFNRHTRADLVQAAEYLRVAVAIDPSSLSAREYLAKTLREQGDNPGADAQEKLLLHLRAHKP